MQRAPADARSRAVYEAFRDAFDEGIAERATELWLQLSNGVDLTPLRFLLAAQPHLEFPAARRRELLARLEADFRAPPRGSAPPARAPVPPPPHAAAPAARTPFPDPDDARHKVFLALIEALVDGLDGNASHLIRTLQRTDMPGPCRNYMHVFGAGAYDELPRLGEADMTALLDRAYEWTCALLGPAHADRYFARAVADVSERPEATHFSPRRLL